MQILRPRAMLRVKDLSKRIFFQENDMDLGPSNAKGYLHSFGMGAIALSHQEPSKRGCLPQHH